MCGGGSPPPPPPPPPAPVISPEPKAPKGGRRRRSAGDSATRSKSARVGAIGATTGTLLSQSTVNTGKTLLGAG